MADTDASETVSSMDTTVTEANESSVAIVEQPSSANDTKAVDTTTTSTSTGSLPTALVGDDSLRLSVLKVPKLWGLNKFESVVLRKINVPYVKAKKPSGQQFAQITFANLEDRAAGRDAINNGNFNGMQFKATDVVRKRHLDQHAEGERAKVKRQRTGEATDGDDDAAVTTSMTGDDDDVDGNTRTLSESSEPKDIRDVTTPLWKLSYEEQLQFKRKALIKVLKRITRQTEQSSKNGKPEWLKAKKNHHVCCYLDAIHPSPKQTGYRNKISLTIGYSAPDESGVQRKLVGFAAGRVIKGVTTVASLENSLIVSEHAKAICQLFQEVLDTSEYEPHCKITHSGEWRVLTVRTFSTGDAVSTVLVYPSNVTPEKLLAEKERVKSLWTERNAQNNNRYGSLLWQEYEGVANVVPNSWPVEVLFGQQYCTETLFGLNFRVSPNAFFQINTAATEILYGIVRNWCAPTSDSILIDLCCGTGTIGLSMASQVKQVIGVDMIEDAIVDARYNAEHNNITNAKFIAAKAEAVATSLMAEYGPQGNCIGVVDPPRAGLHLDVIRAIRKCAAIKQLIYVSCNQDSLVQNAAALCRLASKHVGGENFVPVRSEAVDMFPQTDQAELVMLFQRESVFQANKAAAATAATAVAVAVATTEATAVDTAATSLADSDATTTAEQTVETSSSTEEATPTPQADID